MRCGRRSKPPVRTWQMASKQVQSERSFLHHVLRLAIFVLIFFLLLPSSSTLAQTQPPNYWQYRASGRIQHIVAADMDYDGIDDFVAVDETGKVDLLDANGRLQNSFTAPGPVFSVHTTNVKDTLQSKSEIVLGLQNRLILLSATGAELWQVPLVSLTTPIDLLVSGDLETEDTWQEPYESVPAAIDSLDVNGDGYDEILVLLNSGQLQLFDAAGNLIWRYIRNNNPTIETQPQMTLGDFDQDSENEIALGFFNPHLRFSQLALIDGNGRLRWDQEQPISGRLTALSTATYNGQQAIAVGTNLGQVALYNGDRQRLLFRTVNKPVTTLTAIPLEDGPGFLIGTDSGSLIAYNEQGRRQWTRHLAPGANRSIISLSVAPSTPQINQPALAVNIGQPGGGELSDVVILSRNGRSLDTLASLEALGPIQLLDMNGDANNELLLARFAQLELLGLSIGADDIASDWDYDLLGLPSSQLVIDFNQDGEDELLVGTEDGRIHRLNNDGSFSWVVNPGGAITHLETFPNSDTDIPDVIVARNNPLPQTDDTINYQSWIALRQANGEQIWEQAISSQINSLQVAELDDQNHPEIIIGTSNGNVIAFASTGNELWQTTLPEPVIQLLVVNHNPTSEPIIIAVTSYRLYQINSDAPPWLIGFYQEQIHAVYPTDEPGDEPPKLTIFLADNQAYGLTLQGKHLPQWPLVIDAPPSLSAFAQKLPGDDLVPQNARIQDTTNSFLLTTSAGHLRSLVIEDNNPRLSWLLTGLGNITSLYWGDLNSDGIPDMALGNENGRVNLYEVSPNTRRPVQSDRLNLGSRVFALTALKRENSQKSDLLAITQNGVVQLFRVQANWPPLLTNPEAIAIQGRYSFNIQVADVEQDEVAVRLDIFNHANQQWVTQETQRLLGDSDTLLWLVDDPSVGEKGVQYRFHYNDGFHQGEVTPPPGPQPIPLPSLTNDPRLGWGILGISSLIIAFVYFRQAKLPTAQVRRFYRSVTQDPSETLLLLENEYQTNDTLSDFLLSLANRARQRHDTHMANLVDGLFLMANQPVVGLPIVLEALDEIQKFAFPQWRCMERWQQMFTLGDLLLKAPSITELSLLHPQFEQFLLLLEDAEYWSPSFTKLMPIMRNLRDSKRVDLAEDSLVYLNEASGLLVGFWDEDPDYSSVERPLAVAIVDRWMGLVSAEIAEIRGRANLVVTLKTKRLIPTEHTEVALEIWNNGRAAAENLIAELAENPAYASNGRPQIIALLPPGRTQQINFSIEPKVKDRFRLVLNLTYDDRNQQDKAMAYGDMVHLLPPVREFRSIPNPYLPGTPLRHNSVIFFGREELFAFIAESADRLSQRNVLILVGQRRTGKTSVLLRLGQHLPSKLLPVYIDCQSLGVTPGMPNLLFDLAWTIADALSTRGIDLDVPEMAVWQEKPTQFFQRQFLTKVKTLLPDDTTLLLVFDEFEAFENLVQDGILPPTFFPYLRHLMQHSDGLSFVFVGTRRLEEMSADYWSVLFNIALYQKIGYLEKDVAARLIQEPVTPNLIYDDLAIDKILRVTAGHPYFLQLVCYTLVKRANSKRRSYVTISNVNAALDEMLTLGEVHFAYLWQRSTYAERALLTAVSHLMDQEISYHPTDMVQYLEPYGIHLTPADVTSALKSLVERDILQEVTEGTTALYELKIGLVGLWVAKQKSLSQLYSSSEETVKREQQG